MTSTFQSFTVSTAILITALSASLVSCSGSGFRGRNDNAKKEAPKKQEDSKPVATPTPTPTPPAPVNNNPQPVATPFRTPSIVLPPIRPETFQPPVQPRPTPVAERPIGSQPPPSNEVVDGSIKFAVLGIFNQDTQSQITNDGYRVQLSTDAGELLVSAPVDVFSLIHGEPADSQNGSPLAKPFVLHSKTWYISPKITDGSLTGVQKTKMDVCLPSNINAPYNQYAECAPMQNQGHSNGINHIQNAQATVNFSNRNINVQRIDGVKSYGSCSSENGMPCVALGHAAAAAPFGRPDAQGEDKGSPLVLDMSANNSLDLVSAWDKKIMVKYDISGSGEKVRTGWIGKKAGLLAMDLNANGRIDNGRELFGEYSRPADAREGDMIPAKTFLNGFTALAQYAHGASFIDEKTPEYAKLLVWTDRNLNGETDKGELKSLKELGISRIDLKTTAAPKAMQRLKDNRIDQVASFTMNGKEHVLADVYFALRPFRSVAEILKKSDASKSNVVKVSLTK